MTGHTSEEKMKILYEDSLREIRGLAKSMAAISSAITDAAQLMAKGKSVIRADNERILLGAVNDIKIAMANIIVARDNLNETAANSVRTLMIGDDGPIKQLDRLVRSQHDALGWINKAAKFYEESYVLKPMFLALALGGLFGGLAGGLVGTLILKFG